MQVGELCPHPDHPHPPLYTVLPPRYKGGGMGERGKERDGPMGKWEARGEWGVSKERDVSEK